MRRRNPVSWPQRSGTPRLPPSAVPRSEGSGRKQYEARGTPAAPPGSGDTARSPRRVAPAPPMWPPTAKENPVTGFHLQQSVDRWPRLRILLLVDQYTHVVDGCHRSIPSVPRHAVKLFEHAPTRGQCRVEPGFRRRNGQLLRRQLHRQLRPLLQSVRDCAIIVAIVPKWLHRHGNHKYHPERRRPGAAMAGLGRAPV